MRASLVLETTEDLTEPSSPLLQIQIHRFCAFRGRESGFDPHHSHLVFPSYFRPPFSKSALIIPSVKPYTNRPASIHRNLIPRDRLSRSQSLDVDLIIFYCIGYMCLLILKEIRWRFYYGMLP